MKYLRQLSLIKLLLLTSILKGMVFLSLIPLWHGPDEQAHFAQVQYFAERLQPIPNDNQFMTTSQEVDLSEELLGTERDGFGKNKFTHRPDYRLEYTHAITGKYESLIRRLPWSSRTTLVKREATQYPPLYYLLGAVAYRLVYPTSLFSRVFAVRFVSLIIGLIMIWLVYKMGTLVFPKQPLLAIASAMLVSFQPMFSFLTTSINSDNLMNLIYTAVLYLSLKLIVTQRLPINYLLSLVAATLAGLLTKPHFKIIFLTLLTLPLFLRSSLRQAYKTHKSAVLLLCLALVSLGLIKAVPLGWNLITGHGISFGEVSIFALTRPDYPVSLPQHVLWTLRHTIAEVIPWYWGVFNWLGVTLPRGVNRVLNRLLLVAALGIIIWLWRHRRTRQWTSSDQGVIFLFVSNMIFFTALLIWDWLFVRANSFSFGIQGRYYFPLLSSHMILLLLGLVSLIPAPWPKQAIIKIIGLASIALNLIGLNTLAGAYYQIMPFTTFFIQASQYKPWLSKFPFLAIWLTLYALALTLFTYRLVIYADRQRSRA